MSKPSSRPNGPVSPQRAPASAFHFVGNDLALDLINTRVTEDGETVDLLNSPEALQRWLSAAGLGVDSGVDQKGLNQARKLRDAIADLVTAFRHGDAPATETVSTLNGFLSRRGRVQRVAFQGGEYRIEPARPDQTLPDALGEIAARAAELLATAPADKIRRCEAHNCVLVFKDTSRSQKRRWCSMEVCGNRAKAAAFYRKSRR